MTSIRIYRQDLDLALDTSEEAFLELVRRYRPAILATCRKYEWLGFEVDDLRQYALMGLFHACVRVRDGYYLQNQFRTFAGRCMAEEIVDEVRRKKASMRAAPPGEAPRGVREREEEGESEIDRVPADRRSDPLVVVLAREEWREFSETWQQLDAEERSALTNGTAANRNTRRNAKAKLRAALGLPPATGKPLGRRASPLEPFRDHVEARFADDPGLDAKTLFGELVAAGFNRSYPTLRRELRRLDLRPVTA